ncbi:hypothetical protein PLESTB_000685800 [Pleodorina starrii]|uniref:MPBQ/MBSQ family SAM-binding methyltransferase profile domain-containing protein n=1 Tax=Pleodorina starrii TaxID=330485 RepID=A0A9W6BJD1_9CHLO|nr:hypothetical protein PLESTM_001231200 [Pleodorina starrii]GLC52898.1 hypothetical protein PLESTB_000685800 [Pleodorina starrii]GLC65197.1 hypothetical protein PLESTF_000262500 [Pleodorina starrii]
MLTASPQLIPNQRVAEASCSHPRSALPVGRPLQRSIKFSHQRSLVLRSAAETYSREVTAPRLIQHKNEAYWFYAGLSQVYDHIVNPGHWTEDMREEALVPAKLDDPNLKVVDVGGGTGFTTLGIVKTIAPENVTLIDQSPHQLAKAKAKPALKGVTILEGDAEDLPFPTDSFDRYVSAGSIEYWPEPQRGIKEAYRVIKEGGTACVIGPVHPTFWLSRFFADVWMLFPKEEEYIEWFTKAGFTDVKITRIGPKWYRGVRRHGLIMGCSVTGVKPKAGESPLAMGPKAEVSNKMNSNPLSFLMRLLLGTAAGFYYFLVPVYMYLKNLVWPKGLPM